MGVLPVGRGLKVVIRGNGLHPPKIVQHPHLGDVELGKKPIMVRGPVLHLWVSREQPLFSKLQLRRVVHLQDGSRQDDSGTQRTLGVQALLDTVVCLGQGHGERSLGVHLHNNNNQCCLTLLLKWTCYCNQIWLETLQHYQQLLKEKVTCYMSTFALLHVDVSFHKNYTWTLFSIIWSLNDNWLYWARIYIQSMLFCCCICRISEWDFSLGKPCLDTIT